MALEVRRRTLTHGGRRASCAAVRVVGKLLVNHRQLPGLRAPFQPLPRARVPALEFFDVEKEPARIWPLRRRGDYLPAVHEPLPPFPALPRR
jgi:hypothetical protein